LSRLLSTSKAISEASQAPGDGSISPNRSSLRGGKSPRTKALDELTSLRHRRSRFL